MADVADQANATLERAMDPWPPDTWTSPREQGECALERAMDPWPPDTWTSPREQGECADCGNTIEPERLQVHPFAVRCVECQQIYEEAMTRG